MAVLGIGFSSVALPAEVIELARQVSAGYQLEAIGTLASKRESAVMIALEKFFTVPVLFYTPAELETVRGRLNNPSAQLFTRIGCHGVAEAAALLAAGTQSVLIVEKTNLKHASAALAQ